MRYHARPLSPKQAARFLSISLRTFYRYRLMGTIPTPDVYFGTRKSQRWYARTLGRRPGVW